MGLGLSALAAILLLLPGFGFIIGLGRLTNPSTPSTAIDQHISVALIAATSASIFFHAAALPLAGFWAWSFMLPEPDPSQAISLLAAATESAGYRHAESSLRDHAIPISWYFVATTFVAWTAGRWLNSQLPVRDPWYALLAVGEERGVDFIVVTVNVDIDTSCHLFTGVLADFRVDASGNLNRLVLSYAARRRFSGPESKTPRGHRLGQGWVEIPGEYLVINVAPHATINLDYYFIDPDDEEPDLLLLPPPGGEPNLTP